VPATPTPPGAPATFCTAETHLSWLIMIGGRVLKVKKPVWTEFVDLTTLQARRDVTEAEVRLNRRLAPDVYLGVATLAGADGLDEPVVVMRRMPDGRRLALLASRGDELHDEVSRLAAVLADFHRSAEPVPGAGGADDVLARWRANTAELHTHGAPYVSMSQVDRLQSLAERYVLGRRQLFADRVAAGRVRDGHGDLLADDVFLLEDGPRVLDCLEFDSGLRAGDVLADIAFLAMDLERLGRPELSAQLLSEHRRLLGDDWPPSLADHWIAYRAQVRAKVACLRASQGDATAAAQARGLLDLAERRARAAQVRLVVVGGTPGTGKSSLAAAVAERTGWTVLRSDVVRQDELPHDQQAGALDEGAYSSAASDRVLHAMLAAAQAQLTAGRSVVLDATFASPAWRTAASELARATCSDLTTVRTRLPDAVADERMRLRTAAGTDASQATVELAPALRARFTAWPEATELDMQRPLHELVTDVLTPVLCGCEEAGRPGGCRKNPGPISCGAGYPDAER